MKRIKEIGVSGKRVFVRVDFNVPLDARRKITDDTRIRAVVPTLKLLLDQGASLIIGSHLGRPKGKVAPEFSLAPVAQHLGQLLGRSVRMAPDCIGDSVSTMVSRLAPGDVLLLENLRFHPGEEKNDPGFARNLAGLCDIYVNDAFAVSHRSNASVDAICRFAPLCAAGLLLCQELDYFARAMADPQRPLVAIVGGAKVSTKLKALENMLDHVDKVLIGGAMANTFLKNRGCSVGSSLVEDALLESAGTIMAKAAKKGVAFYLPVDAVVAQMMEATAATRTVSVLEIPAGWMALDIGPATTALYGEVLADAKTIVWNGPMGVFEMAPFSHGTLAMVHAVAGSDALSIVGGGDTDTAIHQSGQSHRIGYISTGGGAFLELLEGKMLPAVAALEAASD